MTTVKDIYEFIDTIAPYCNQCEWDNSGLIAGDRLASVGTVAFALDLTGATLKAAKEGGADLIVTHHPAIFGGMKTFLSPNPVYDGVVSGISVISAHTCFDCADGGVNDVLAGMLGLEDTSPVPSGEVLVPMARVGFLHEEMSGGKFASFVAEKLKTTVRFVDGKKNAKKVAVCGGSGMSFLDDVIKAGADTFVTGDIKHHEMLEAAEKGVNVIAAGHFETEFPAMYALEERIKNAFDVKTFVINQENPVKFIG